MKNLFDVPPKKHSNNRCRECKHIANLNPHSDRYWYCTLYRSERTPYGVKAVKRMNQACDKFEIMKTPINEEVISTAIFGEDIKDGNAIYLADGGSALALTKNQEPFPLKQLFSIVDGRLSTSISDIQGILGVYYGRRVFTHELPELIEEVESAKPDWYMQANGIIEYVKWRKHTDDFVKLMDILDKDFSNVYIMVEEKSTNL